MIAFGHPSRKALLRWAADGGPGAVSRHLRSCDRCRAFVAGYRELQRDVGALDFPVASDSVLTRILDTRSACDRVLLPFHDSVRRRPVASYAAIAAAVTVCGTAALLWTSRVERVETSAEQSVPRLERGVVAGLVFPAPARAQILDPQPGQPSSPAIDGARVRAGVWTFEMTRSNDGVGFGPAERGVVSISPDLVNGRATWRVENEWQGHPGDPRETTWYSARTLVPLQRRATNVGHSEYTVEQSIAPGQLTGWMYRPGVRRPIRRELSRAAQPLLAGEGAPILFFQGVSLRPGWSATVFLLGWGDQPEDLVHPLQLTVIGEDRVTVPAGTFDCWRVNAGGIRQIWVRKPDGIPVRIQEIVESRVRTQVVLTDER